MNADLGSVQRAGLDLARQLEQVLRADPAPALRSITVDLRPVGSSLVSRLFWPSRRVLEVLGYPPEALLTLTYVYGDAPALRRFLDAFVLRDEPSEDTGDSPSEEVRVLKRLPASSDGRRLRQLS